MKEHELKCHPEYFHRVVSGQKPFEIRKNDRDYQVGDVVILKEFDPALGWPDHGSYSTYTGRITYLTTFAQQDGWCVFALEPIE